MLKNTAQVSQHKLGQCHSVLLSYSLARLMLAGLSLLVSILCYPKLYKTRHTGITNTLRSVWCCFFGWSLLIEIHKFVFSHLCETRNCQNLYMNLPMLPPIKTPSSFASLRRNSLAPQYDYCFHSHLIMSNTIQKPRLAAIIASKLMIYQVLFPLR